MTAAVPLTTAGASEVEADLSTGVDGSASLAPLAEDA